MTSIRQSVVISATIIVLLIAIGGGVAFKAIMDGKHGTEFLFVKRLSPLLELQHLNQGIKEIRFQLASVSLEQTSTVRARKYIEEEMPRLRRSLEVLQATTRDASVDVQNQVNAISQGFARLEQRLLVKSSG